MARGHNLSDKTEATQINADFHYLITQTETVDGVEDSAVRRMTPEIYEMSAVPADIRLAIATMIVAQRQIGFNIDDILKSGIGTINLTNAQEFPFNNSQTSVALQRPQSDSNYIVVAFVETAVGNVGEIEIADKLTNGFKISYSGSAKSATIKYIVIGGFQE